MRAAALLGLALLALLGAEWVPRAAPPPSYVPAIDARAPPPPPREPAAALTRVLGRPLFSPLRRPPADRVAAIVSSHGQDVPALRGTIISSARRVALLARNGATRPVTENDLVGPYRVARIGAGEVSLRDHDGVTVVLRLVGGIGAEARAVPAAAAPSLALQHKQFPEDEHAE